MATVPKHIEAYLVPDFIVRQDFSIVLLQPKTDEARDWCNDHLPEDAPMFGSAYAVEARYAQAILEGLDDDGLTYQVA